MVLRVLAFPIVFGSLFVGSISSSYAQQAEAPSGPPASTATNPPPSSEVTQKTKTASAAATAVEEAVSNTAHLTALADNYQKTVTDITGTAVKSKKPPLEDLQTLQAVVQAIQQQGDKGLFDLLARAGKALDSTKTESAEAKRASACAELDKAANAAAPQQDATDAQAACAKAAADASAAAPAPGTASTALQNALRGIYKYVQDRTTALSDKLKPLQSDKLGASSKPDAAILIGALTTGMPTLKSVLEDRQQYQSMWEGTKPKLDSLLNTAAPDPKHVADCKAIQSVEDSFSCLQTSVDAITPQLGGWIAAIQLDLQASAVALDTKLSGVASDPSKNSAEANGAVKDYSEKIASVQPILDAWPPLVGFLKDRQPDSFSLKSTKTALESLQTAQNTLRASVSRMHDALAGDMSQFETDQVSLYYFTDVNRLMHALNENTQTRGGVAEAQAQAAAQRIALTQTELDLADAQAAVNRYQKQVLDLQEQQRQLMAKLSSQDSQLSKLGDRLKRAQATKAAASDSATAAQGDAQKDPAKSGDARRATAAQSMATTKQSQAQSDYDAAKKQRDDTQSQLDNSQNQSDSLPAKLESARQALSGAQTAVSQDRRKMLMAAQAESDAFALARDNTPYLYASADASSNDPAKRVILYAYNDSKTIFMRGKPDDLLIVKDIIAKFDQPAPQARLSLWTFQLNADSNQKTSKDAAARLNESMRIVDEELSTARAMENATLALFRKLINDEVQEVEDDFQALTPTWTSGTGIEPATPADEAKWRRAHFFNRDVLKELHIDLAHPNLGPFREIVPDPSGTTTLGESLMSLCLAEPRYQANVRDKFRQQWLKELKKLPAIDQLKEKGSFWRKNLQWDKGDISEYLPKDTEEDHALALTWRALDLQPDPADHESLTATQLEIARALRAAYNAAQIRKQVNQLDTWYRNRSFFEKERDQAKNGIDSIVAQGLKTLSTSDRNKFDSLQKSVNQNENELRRLETLQATLSLADQSRLKTFQTQRQDLDDLKHKGVDSLPVQDRSAYYEQVRQLNKLEATLANLAAQSQTYRDLLKKGYGFAIDAFPGEAPKDTLFRFKMALLGAYPPGATAPRIAAADEMLKELVIALEDDIDRTFVQPMIVRLRQKLTQDPQVRVGIIERESLLATNRGVARIDARASAHLAVGDQEDILTGIQQLAQLYATVQSGGALAAIGALQRQPREPPPEIYALTTGNQFQVTPIFDPTGQALRFKFDFVATTKLQEPNGTTNPQLPRVERHTVNTEVQLSNLETREISRFESNAKLGLPETFWGGIPILKDIPGVRHNKWFPLIAWFVRKAGSNSSAQQSVIFGQTTIYPTISTIVTLLSGQNPQPQELLLPQ
jgi:hypothetical protein